MGVYEIAYEVVVEGRIVNRAQHIECPDFRTAALYAIEFEQKFQHPVKALGFLFKIAERIQPEKREKDNGENNHQEQL